jgi:magnesium chelatase family protein
MSGVTEADLARQRARAPGEGVAEDDALRARIANARAAQRTRNGDCLNAELDVARLDALAAESRESTRTLDAAHHALGLSMRSLTRVRRVARTLADLDGAASVSGAHAAEAIQLRRGFGMLKSVPDTGVRSG